jgi:hypothetical protein
MKFLKKLLLGESGQALPMALILLVLGGLLVVPTLSLMTTTLQANTKTTVANLGYYAADAGIEDAYWKMTQQTITPSVPSGTGQWYTLTSQPNGMTVTLANAKAPAVNGSDTTYFISSTAAQGGQTAYVIVVQITRTVSTGSPGSGSYVFGDAIIADGGSLTQVDLSGNSNVTIKSSGSGGTNQGNIYATGGISFNKATVYGNATATGDIQGVTDVGGTITKYGQQQIFTPLDLSVYKLSESEGQFHYGDWTINSGTVNVTGTNGLHITGSFTVNQGNITFTGPIHIHGNLTVNSNSTITVNGDVYVDGNITLNSNNSIQGTGNFIAGGNVTLNSNITLNESGIPLIASATGNITANSNINLTANLYAPNGSITMNSNDVVNGALFAKSISMNSNVTIIYPTDEGYQNIRGGPGTPQPSISLAMNQYSKD